ncbi:hypothetical protein AVEN_67534-1 [Araneus ventricosus]|uniref:Uncharacterized protein n=1 Tax=Araneus ventricosus TaxID=182803 RepID=A0A4Y2QIZ7_ARAVE|nr:hypothetical protein AVEN_67534-1 [Araneus ventricosus]
MKCLQDDSKTNHRRKRIDRLQLIIGFSLCFIMPVGFLLHSIELCLPGNEELLAEYVSDSYFGWCAQDNWINCLVHTTTDILVLNQQYTLPNFIAVLSCYIFGLLERKVDSFTVNRQPESFKSLFKTYSVYYTEIHDCVSQVERTLSALLFIVFGFMLCSIFNVTTFLFTVDYRRVDLIVLIPQLMSAFFIFTGFCMTSLRAVAIHNSAIKVKAWIHNQVARSEFQCNKRKVLILIMANEFPSKVVVTAGKLLVLKNCFIWGTMSGIVSYGLILSQLGKYQ